MGAPMFIRGQDLTSFIATGGNYTDQQGTIAYDGTSSLQFAGRSTFGGVEFSGNPGLVQINSVDDMAEHNVRTLYGVSSAIVELNVQNDYGLGLLRFTSDFDLLKWVAVIKSSRYGTSSNAIEITYEGAIGPLTFGHQNIGENTTNMHLASINKGKSGGGAQLYNLSWQWITV